MSTRQNLFPTGVPVKGGDMVGREKDIREMMLLLESGQSIILIGPRRYGKTSIALEVLSRLKKKYLTSDADIFRTISKKDLAEKIVESTLLNKEPGINGLLRKFKESISELLKRVEIKKIISDYEIVLRFAEKETDEDKLLEDALEFPEVFAKKEKRQLFFYYDEFGDINKLNGNALIKRMRAIFQRQENITYIFSGSSESMMGSIFQNKKGAFYKFGRIINIEVPPKDALVNYIVKKFNRIKIHVDKSVAGGIVDKMRAHPYYVQFVCQELYKQQKMEGKRRIRETDVKEAIERAIISETISFEGMWLDLSRYKNHLLILRQIVLRNGRAYQCEGLSKYSIYKALVHMKKTGYIKQAGEGTYFLIDPLFEEYLKLKWN